MVNGKTLVFALYKFTRTGLSSNKLSPGTHKVTLEHDRGADIGSASSLSLEFWPSTKAISMATDHIKDSEIVKNLGYWQ